MRWALPFGVQVAMSTANDGDLRVLASRERWCDHHAVPTPVVLRQIHGTHIIRVDHQDQTAREPRAGDGILAYGAGVSLAVFGADCPPLIVATPTCLGVAHCGWRGTAAGIVSKLITSLSAIEPTPPSTWYAFVAPGVHPADFEVDAPVLNARSWPRDAMQASRPGHAWLDLPASVASDCADAGLRDIARCRLTTSRNPGLRSHRRDGPGFPLMCVAWRPACAG
ncbi:MAG: polyphenol oxidase family protein [Planctomycetota bacterium]